MAKAVATAREREAGDARPFGHCEPLGFGDEGTGGCLYYPEGVPDNELEAFFEEDNARLLAKWKDLGFVG